MCIVEMDFFSCVCLEVTSTICTGTKYSFYNVQGKGSVHNHDN